MPRVDRVNKYRVPAFKATQSGAVKMRFLEHFASTPGAHSARDVSSDPQASDGRPGSSARMSAKVQLLRYYRAGLLERERRGRAYYYTITTRGEKRLIHMWRARGLLNPDGAKTDLERLQVENRLLKTEELLQKRLAELDDQEARATEEYF